MADKSIKDLVEQAISDLIQDGKIEIQDDEGNKIDDLSLGLSENDDEDFDDEDFDDEDEDDDREEDDSDEEDNN